MERLDWIQKLKTEAVQYDYSEDDTVLERLP